MTDREVSFIVRVKDAASAALKQIENTAHHTTEAFFDLGDILKGFKSAIEVISLGAIITDVIELGIEATKTAAETDKLFRQVSAVLPTGTAGVHELTKAIDELSITTGIATENLEQAALQAAQLGAGSAEDVQQLVTAAVKLSDATGTPLSESVALLRQMEKEFHLTGDAALDTAAKLAAAARGKVAVAELFSAFQGASPIFQQFGIDVDTGTRAIVALIAKGYGVRQVRGEINALDGEGIRQLAAQATIATDAMSQLEERAARVENSTDRLAQKLKNDFNVHLKELGNVILPKVNAALELFLSLTSKTAGESIALGHAIEALTKPASFPSAGATNDQSTAIEYLERTFRAKKDELRAVEGIGVGGASAAATKALFASLPIDQLKALYATTQQWGESAAKGFQVIDAIAGAYQRATTAAKTTAEAGSGLVLPLKAAEKQKIASDLAQAQKAAEQFALTSSKSVADAATAATEKALADIAGFRTKFVELARDIQQKIAALPKGATAEQRQALDDLLTQAAGNYASGVQERFTALDRATTAETAKLRDELSETAGQLASDLSKIASAQLIDKSKAKEVEILFSDISVAEKQSGIDAEEALQRRLRGWLQLKPTVESTEELIKRADSVIKNADVAGFGEASTRALNDVSVSITLQEQLLVAKGKEKGLSEEEVKNSQLYRDLQQKALDIMKEMAKVLGTQAKTEHDTADSAKRQLQDIADQARAMGDVVNGATQLATAFGLVDERTGRVLQSIGEIASRIPILVSQLQHLGEIDATGNPVATLGSLASAALPIAGGIATVVSALLQRGSKEDEERARALEQNTAAIRELTKHAGLIGQNIGLTGTDVSSVATLIQGILGLKVGHTNIASGAQAKVEGLTQDQIDQLNAAAKALGITFDGTFLSVQQLQYALEQVGPLLGKFGDDVQSMLGEIDAEAKILGKSSPLDNLAGILEKLGAKSAGIASIFSGIDTSKALSAEDIATIRARVQDLFKQMEGEGLTAEQRGALNGDQFLQLLEQIIADLDQLGTVAQSAADKLKSALTGTQQSEQIHHVADPVQLFADKAKDYAAFGGALGDLFHGLDLNHLSPDQIAGLDKSIQDLFDALKTAPDSVDTAGLSIDDFIQALLDLSGAASSVANTIKSAAQQISDAENQIAVSDDILGTSGQATIGELSKAYGIDLSQFDLSNQAGANAAIASLQNTFKGLNPSDTNYDLSVHEIQSLVDKLRGLTFTDGGAPDLGGLTGIPSFRDSYHEASVGTVSGISDAEASGILGELATANTYLSALPDIRELLSVWVSNKTLYGGPAPGAWQASMGQRLGSGIGAAIGSSLGSAAAGAFADGAGSGAPGPIVVNVIVDGRKIAEAVSDAYLDPGSYQQLDRANARAVNRARAGAGLAKKK